MEISSKSQAENGADNTTIMTPLRVKQAINANGGGGGTTDYTALTNKPQINSITLEGNKTGAQLGLASSSDIPTKTSDLTNDGDGTHPFLLNGSPSYIDTISTYGGSSSYARNLSYTWDNGVTSESHIIANYEDIPTRVSDLQNDSGFITGMTILSYGSSTWQDFLSAYTANKVVYCRASSNSNPATGAQNRLAFMAYVNNATSPTEVEFQYYRSVSTHTASQQGDQVYVYKLNSSGTWTVTIRAASSKVTATGGLTTSFASDTVTVDGSDKQETLVSGTNIKTINNQSLLGSGNIDIHPGGVQSDWNQTDSTADDYIKNKPTIPVVPTNVSAFTNDAGYLTSYTETDPVFSSSAASGITSSDITSWNGKQNTIIAGDGIDKLNDTLSLEIPTYYWDGTDTADNRAMFNEICGIYDNGGKFILYGRLLMDAGWSYNGTYTSDPRSVVVPITVTDFTSREAAGSTYYSFSSSPVYIGYRYIIGTVKATGSWGAFTKVEWATYNEDMSPARLSEVNAKQDTLVSGTNIKTINNTSLLGSGNIDIQGSVPANVAYKNIDNNFSTGQTINGSTHIHPPANEWTGLDIYSSNRNEASIAYHNEALTKRYVVGYGTAGFDGWGVYADETTQNLLRVDKDGNSIATKSFKIPVNSNNGYGLTNTNGNSIIRDWGGAVTVDATGSDLYLGFERTNAINFLNGKGMMYSDGSMYMPTGFYSKETGNVGTASGTGKLVIKRASSSEAPNNGVVLEFGNSTSWTGQLYIGDNATQGIYYNGWSNGVRGSWRRLADEPVSLYDNSSGQRTGTIALSETSANFQYIEIFYKPYSDNVYNDNRSGYGSVKVYQPNGKKVQLTLDYDNGSKWYHCFAAWTFSGASLIKNTEIRWRSGTGGSEAQTRTDSESISDQNINIVKIIGYR